MALALALLMSLQSEKLVSPTVAKAPAIDGNGGDEAWATAKAVELTSKGVFPTNKDKSTTVQLKSVHTASHLYLQVRWKDETKDDQLHKPWTWDDAKGAYAEGPEREDMLSVAFEHTGPFNPDMLAGVESTWDVGHWKASRTNPQGFAMDRTHRYTKEQVGGKGKQHKARNGDTVWIFRPEDAGDTVEKKQAAPPAKGEAKVTQYLAGTPTGSAADVKAKAAWADGWWTLEFERKLDTGHPDDTVFALGKAYKMAVGTHNRTGDMDKATGVLEISIAP